MRALAEKIWHYNRSLTGEGVRQTHAEIAKLFDLETFEVPSGSEHFDWTIPPEWNVTQAYIVRPSGERIADFSINNLYLVGYSVPFHGTLTRDELMQHLHSIPELPDAIPYVTSYYKRRWGFCLSHNQLLTLEPGDYEVVVQTSLDDTGSLTYSEATFGNNAACEDFILLQSYTCHPSLAINELSGPLVLAGVGQWLKTQANLKHTYKLLFCPETIGSVVWIARNAQHIQNMKAGLVITCVGHDGPFTYKRTKQGSYIDRLVEAAFLGSEQTLDVRPFTPFGSDERQYNSIGLGLPVGSLMRTPYHEYPEYHSSLDNLDLMSFDALQETINKYIELIRIIECDDVYKVRQLYCEPFLSKYGPLYYSTDHRTPSDLTRCAKWLMHYCDGRNTIVDIALISGIHPLALADVVLRMLEAEAVIRVPQEGLM
jgi:aminopeptidase-like protein